jgi:hypothetical protein
MLRGTVAQDFVICFLYQIYSLYTCRACSFSFKFLFPRQIFQLLQSSELTLWVELSYCTFRSFCHSSVLAAHCRAHANVGLAEKILKMETVPDRGSLQPRTYCRVSGALINFQRKNNFKKLELNASSTHRVSSLRCENCKIRHKNEI